MTELLPPWGDEPAVTEYIRQLIDQSRTLNYNDPRPLLLGHLSFNAPPPVRVELMRIFEIESERAITAAKEEGNYVPLFKLLESKHPLNNSQYEIELRRALSAEAYDLIAAIGAHRMKRAKAGRPKLTDRERRARSPIHNAADDFRVARAILRQLYPEQLKDQIDDRAFSVAAQMHKTGVETLRDHLRRSKRDRHRSRRP
jgi:hypothetical protein